VGQNLPSKTANLPVSRSIKIPSPQPAAGVGFRDVSDPKPRIPQFRSQNVSPGSPSRVASVSSRDHQFKFRSSGSAATRFSSSKHGSQNIHSRLPLTG